MKVFRSPRARRSPDARAAPTLRRDLRHAPLKRPCSRPGSYQRSSGVPVPGDNTPPDHRRQGRKVIPEPATRPRPSGPTKHGNVAGVGVGTGFVSLTTLWRAYRRQRYRSWSSADAEGAFCVVCVQFLALCRRWAQQASLLGQVLDCRRRRECTQWCWSASVWQLGAAGGES